MQMLGRACSYYIYFVVIREKNAGCSILHALYCPIAGSFIGVERELIEAERACVLLGENK
jgi:hypothetical protein